MTCPNLPDRGTRSEGGIDAAVAATETRVLLRLRVPGPVRDPTSSRVPPAAGMILLRILRPTGTPVAESVAISVTKQTESPPPVDVNIVTLTHHARLLAHGLPWMTGVIEVVARVWGNARRPRRNTTLGWKGRRTNGSPPRSERGSRLSKIVTRGISRSHPRMVFGSKVHRRFPFF